MNSSNWNPNIAEAPSDGTEFQAWVRRPEDEAKGYWEPKCRINPKTGSFEIWGRVDYDEDGWDSYPFIPTHWMPHPQEPK